MIRSCFIAAALGLGLAGAASASSYDIAFDGASLDFTAHIVTDGSDLVTSITGTVNGTDAIAALVPTGTNGSWLYDNLFGASTDWVDYYGVLFTTVGGITANLFYDAGTDEYLVSYSPAANPNDYYRGTTGTLSVAPVPLPAAGLLLLGGLGALGAAKRRKTA